MACAGQYQRNLLSNRLRSRTRGRADALSYASANIIKKETGTPAAQSRSRETGDSCHSPTTRRHKRTERRLPGYAKGRASGVWARPQQAFCSAPGRSPAGHRAARISSLPAPGGCHAPCKTGSTKRLRRSCGSHRCSARRARELPSLRCRRQTSTPRRLLRSTPLVRSSRHCPSYSLPPIEASTLYAPREARRISERTLLVACPLRVTPSVPLESFIHRCYAVRFDHGPESQAL